MKNIFGFLLLLLMFACHNKNGSASSDASKGKDSSDIRHALSVITQTHIKIEELNNTLQRPWAVIPMAGNKLLITEKSGKFIVMSVEGKKLSEVGRLPPVDDGGQGGLLDVALSPDFETSRLIYWSFSEKAAAGNHLAVAKGRLNTDENQVDQVRVIFRALPSLQSNLHFGSRLQFDKSGNLFVSSGERSILEGRKQAQWLNSGLGKIFKITAEGKPAPGNPYFDERNAMPEIFAIGIRNAQGLALHPVTGELWESEFGPKGGDEINIIRSGKDYGWPTITYGMEYSGSKVGDGLTEKEGMEQPIYYWVPSESPSGIDFYSGSAIPEWKHNLFVACLSGQKIIRLVIENNKVVGEEPLFADKGARFRDVACMGDVVYTITDAGQLYKISKQ